MADLTQEAVKTDKAAITAVTVGVASGLLLAAKPSRVSVTVYNEGAAKVYVTPVNPAVAVTSIPIAAGGQWSDVNYTGALYAISGTAGQDVRVSEVG